MGTVEQTEWIQPNCMSDQSRGSGPVLSLTEIRFVPSALRVVCARTLVLLWEGSGMSTFVDRLIRGNGLDCLACWTPHSLLSSHLLRESPKHLNGARKRGPSCSTSGLRLRMEKRSDKVFVNVKKNCMYVHLTTGAVSKRNTPLIAYLCLGEGWGDRGEANNLDTGGVFFARIVSSVGVGTPVISGPGGPRARLPFSRSKYIPNIHFVISRICCKERRASISECNSQEGGLCSSIAAHQIAHGI